MNSNESIKPFQTTSKLTTYFAAAPEENLFAPEALGLNSQRNSSAENTGWPPPPQKCLPRESAGWPNANRFCCTPRWRTGESLVMRHPWRQIQTGQCAVGPWSSHRNSHQWTKTVFQLSWHSAIDVVVFLLDGHRDCWTDQIVCWELGGRAFTWYFTNE